MIKNKILPNIAFFDSGQGGLTIWEAVLKQFPKLNTQYLGDNARCPYGNKSEDTITRYASEAVLFLSTRNVQLLVVACGTASSVATTHLQTVFKVPIVGIVEGFCRHVSELLQDKTRSVAVLATRFTIKSQKFKTELALWNIKNIWQKACPLFVPLVEEGISKGQIVDSICDIYLKDIPKDVKVIMLACTHYPRLAETLAEYLENHLNRSVIYKTVDADLVLSKRIKSHEDPIYLVDPSTSIIKYVEKFIEQNDPNHSMLFDHEQHILCTDSPEQFEKVSHVFTDIPLQNIQEVELSV
jgi:glutamate racemase